MTRRLIIFIFLACVQSLFFAQSTIEFPFNPDSNGDGNITVEDLMTMLSNYGNQWELPDASQWATSTINNLLEFQSELDSIAMLNENQLEEIANQIITLQNAGDSLQALGNTCFAYPSGANGFQHISIPSTCRHVNVYTGYSAAGSLSIPMRLPVMGSFVGQSITMLLMPSGNAYRSVPVMSMVNGQWGTLDTLVPAWGGNRPTLDYNDWQEAMHPEINKKFIWNGSEWEVISGGVTLLGASSN